MKPGTIEFGGKPTTARGLGRIDRNNTANLPNDFGKSWKKNMGGFGSGRRHGGKSTTSDMRAFDVRRLQRAGLLIPGRAFVWHWTCNDETLASIQVRTEVDRMILSYRTQSNGGEWQQMEYPINLEWTPCTLGGRRVWFLCPAKGCGRRVAILFGGAVFACRSCHKLAYYCQRETDDDRAMRRAETIRGRLGWLPGVDNPQGRKPKGMHWRTFDRLKAEHDAFANFSWAGMFERIELMNQRLERLGLEPFEGPDRGG